MRFHLIDRIVTVEPSKSLTAWKNLTLGEEYLGDHFPGFPVMPGVLMLHTLVEAGAWLLRLSSNYAHSVVVLREAKNIKYGTFMEPGRRMTVQVELVENQGGLAVFKGKGETSGGGTTVSGRFTLFQYNLADKNPGLASTDYQIISGLKQQEQVLRGIL
jgi:3-hydroxyacyl-[acyl-carrier-protein] dehydratase